MSSIFTLDNCEDFSEKLNIDELYERKKLQDQSELDTYNRILNRIHVRIKTTSKQMGDQQLCWFLVPEMIIGIPKYNQGNCIGYVLSKLQANGFRVRYIHPNLLMISWAHFVPSYVRQEYKRKFGRAIDEVGNEVVEDNNTSTEKKKNANANYLSEGLRTNSKPPSAKPFASTSSYKPSGKLF